MIDVQKIKDSKYFDEIMDIYKNLEDYKISYQIEDRRYKFSNPDNTNFLYLNSLNKMDYMNLLYHNNFLDIIDNDVFDLILHQLDERLLLTINEIIFLITKDDFKYIMEVYNTDLESDHIGVYDGIKNAAIINLRGIINQCLNDTSDFMTFYNQVIKIALASLVQDLGCYTAGNNKLPDTYMVAGKSPESVEVYAKREFAKLKENMNVNFIKKDFLYQLYIKEKQKLN